jgi:DNA-binding XRE family transcriptional regulator
MCFHMINHPKRGNRGMTIKEKKQIAKELFMNTALSQKEIAEMVGVSEQALTKWKQDDHWAELKLSITATEQSIYANAMREIEKLQAEGGFNVKQIREYTRFLNTIRPKEEVKISILMDGFIGFAKWLSEKDLETAQNFNKLQFEYISEKMKKLIGK